MQTKQHSRRRPITLKTITTMSREGSCRGDPYHVQRRKSQSAIAYRKPDKPSILLIWITLLNVVLFRRLHIKTVSQFIDTENFSIHLIWITLFERKLFRKITQSNSINIEQAVVTYIGAPYIRRAMTLPVESCK